MDPFDDLLRGVRADGAVFGRSVLAPPWALRFTDGAALTLCVPLRGEGWIVPEPAADGRGGGPRAHRLRSGEVAVVTGPEPFVFTDRPETLAASPPLHEVHCGVPWPGEGAGRDVAAELAGDEVGRTVLMAGAYHVRGEVPRRLLRVLPRVLVVPDDYDCTALRDYLEYQLTGGASAPRPGPADTPAGATSGGPGAAEAAGSTAGGGRGPGAGDGTPATPGLIATPTPGLGAGPAPANCGGRPGSQIVLDRLLDWLLVCTLRDWFDRPEADPPGWYLALGDEVVGPALRAMHRSPERAWTLAALAAEAGVSRTTLAKRFQELVGDSPLAYLTEWRMALAADLLAEPTATVAAVARRVGYADAFGFSSAFKRVRGLSPSAYRGRATAAGAGGELPVRETPGRPVGRPAGPGPTVPGQGAPGQAVPGQPARNQLVPARTAHATTGAARRRAQRSAAPSHSRP
ncbi:AraC family transcriptional regulator [Streptomyces pactum]|uniref:AraC family transcriptional regulator n=1 Tax=Streptomyces pactum TaxID=68249 RepID=UPI0036F77FFA